MSKTFLTLADAFVYYADCQLATVEKMAASRYKTKADYNRQVEIAQEMVDQVKAFNVSPFINIKSEGLTTSKAGLRVYEVISKHEGLVSKWAKHSEVSA